jgi:ubiquitin-protein ligase
MAIKATEKFPRSTVTRLCRDFNELMKYPIKGANAMPMDPTDISIWKAVVTGIEGSPMEGVQVYFGLEFSAEYPTKPPFAYFISPIIAISSSQHLDKKGRTVICNSLFSNYYNHHSDWGAGGAAGWSSSYTVSTILIQMTEMISAGLLISNKASAIKAIKGASIPKEYLIDIPEPTIISKHLTEEEAKTINTDVSGPKCYALQISHIDGFLGICVHKNHIYHGEYLSQEGLNKGVKSTSGDKIFSLWLPMFINADHWEKNRSQFNERFKKKTPSEIISMYSEPFITTIFNFFTKKPKKISNSFIETLMIYYRTMKQLVLENGLCDDYDSELMMFLESNDVAIMESCYKIDAINFLLNKLLNMILSDRFGWREIGLRMEILICEWNNKKTEDIVTISHIELFKIGELFEVIKNYPIEWIDINYGAVDPMTMKTIDDIF